MIISNLFYIFVLQFSSVLYISHYVVNLKFLKLGTVPFKINFYTRALKCLAHCFVCYVCRWWFCVSWLNEKIRGISTLSSWSQELYQSPVIKEWDPTVLVPMCKTCSRFYRGKIQDIAVRNLGKVVLLRVPLTHICYFPNHVMGLYFLTNEETELIKPGVFPKVTQSIGNDWDSDLGLLVPGLMSLSLRCVGRIWGPGFAISQPPGALTKCKENSEFSFALCPCFSCLLAV